MKMSSILVTVCFLLLQSARASLGGSPRGRFGRVADDNYVVSPESVDEFKERGYTVLSDFLSENEVNTLEETYDRFMARDIHVPGKDFCDMSKPFDTPFEEYSIVNCMLPTKYHPPLQGNIFELLAERVCAQIFGGDATLVKDYDQLLNKRPNKGDAVFGWHQDMAYWPPKSLTPDTRTVTFSLAIDSTNTQNGCLKFVPGSGKAGTIRPHRALHGSREEGHAVQADMYPDDDIVSVEVPRGSCSLHDEYVVHGSGGNDSDGNRRTFVLAFRTKATVDKERSMEFTHSHNDETNWDTFKEFEAKEAAVVLAETRTEDGMDAVKSSLSIPYAAEVHAVSISRGGR